MNMRPEESVAKQTEEGSQPIYWSVLHHKNVNAHDESSSLDVGIPRVIREQEPLVKEGNSKSVEYGSVDKKNKEGEKTRHRRKWSKVRELVETDELFLHYMPDDESLVESLCPAHNKASHSIHKWSDINDAAYELTLRECLFLTLILLGCGVLAYSCIFEQWPILDSLYFTIVLLTTVGYGDICPSTKWGKLFASVFALGGIVILGLALGVVGSRLVEAEIEATEKMKAKSAKAMEHAITKSHRFRRPDSMMSQTSYGSEHSLSSLDSVESVTERAENLMSSLGVPVADSMWSTFRSSCQRASGLIQQYLPGFGPLLIGACIIAKLEDWGWVNAIYYCVVTSTTIGFGDLAPTHVVAKMFAVIFIPLAVAAMGYILGQLASFIVEQRREEYYKKLWSRDLKIEDLDALDTDGDGEVNELEYIRFMLVAMKKVDAKLFDDLHQQFLKLDATGDGKITKNDLKIVVVRKMKRVHNKLSLSEYKSKLQKQNNTKRMSFTAAILAVK